MSVARFIADQRTFYRVPHTVSCAILGSALRGCTSGCIVSPPSASAAAPRSTSGWASCSTARNAPTARRVSTLICLTRGGG